MATINPFYDELKSYCVSGGGGGGVGYNVDEDSIGPLYKSVHFQRGFGFGYVDPFPYEKYGLGFGDTISNLFRMAVPYLKQGLKHLGKKAVDTVAHVAHDALEGQNIPEAIKSHAGTAGRELIAKVPRAFSEVLDKSRSATDNDISLDESVVTGRASRKRKKGFLKRRRRQPVKQSRIGGSGAFPLLNELI